MSSTAFWLTICPNSTREILKACKGEDESLNLIGVVLSDSFFGFEGEVDEIVHEFFEIEKKHTFVKLPDILWDFGKLILHEIGEFKNNVQV